MSDAHLHQHILESTFLSRKVYVDVLLPVSYEGSKRVYPTLWLNDGQDLTALRIEATIAELSSAGHMQEIIVVAIHNPFDRMQEYGISHLPDYKSRGAKAFDYSQFVVLELLPLIRTKYRCDPGVLANIFAGCSLGALSAFDIVWNHPHIFSKMGCFSGSFWWRSQEFDDKRPDDHRILQDLLLKSHKIPGLKFWFQAGTLDETSDRNNNQIIDAIDDTLDVIDLLEVLGYKMPDDIRYVEVIDGRHDTDTWAKIFPNFLNWAF